MLKKKRRLPRTYGNASWRNKELELKGERAKAITVEPIAEVPAMADISRLGVWICGEAEHFEAPLEFSWKAP